MSKNTEAIIGYRNASFCLLHTFRESSIPFYSTSNGYNDPFKWVSLTVL